MFNHGRRPLRIWQSLRWWRGSGNQGWTHSRRPGMTDCRGRRAVRSGGWRGRRMISRHGRRADFVRNRPRASVWQGSRSYRRMLQHGRALRRYRRPCRTSSSGDSSRSGIDRRMRNHLCPFDLPGIEMNHVARHGLGITKRIGRHSRSGYCAIAIVDVVDVSHVDVGDVDVAHVRDIDLLQIDIAVVIPREERFTWSERKPCGDSPKAEA